MFNQLPSQQQVFFQGNAPATFQQSQPTRSLFVGDLSFFCTEIELAEAFSRFGEIANTEVKRSRGGDSLMHGFVDFVRETDACRAIQHMNGRKFMGRKLKVNWTNQKSHDNERESWIQVHVNFLCPSIQTKITEEFLETIFVRFGNIADISVKRHLCSFQPQQVTGYAFVYFTDPHTALRAIYGLRSGPINGVFFECCLSYKAEQMLKDVQGMGAVIKRQQTGNPSAFFKRFESRSSNHTNSSINNMPRQPMTNPNAVQYSSSSRRSYSPSNSHSTNNTFQPVQSQLFQPQPLEMQLPERSLNNNFSLDFVCRSASLSPKSISSSGNTSSADSSSIFDFSRSVHSDSMNMMPSSTSTFPTFSFEHNQQQQLHQQYSLFDAPRSNLMDLIM